MPMQQYVLQTQYDSEVGTNYDTSKGTISARLDALETLVANLSIKTTEPTQDNDTGIPQFVYLPTDPVTKYAGYIYIIRT